MEKYKQFEQLLEKAVQEFKELDPNETIRIVSHLDSDGICASAILIKALNLENRKYTISIVHNLDETTIRGLAHENYKYNFFTDIGSGQLNLIKKYLSDRRIFILDHHEPEIKQMKNLTHVNPHLVGIDGSNQVSGAGVVYLFSKTLNKEMENMAHIAVIGAIGDIQDQDGFSDINNMIVEDAVERGKLKKIQGLRLFGVQTRALYKVLEYSSNPDIPGVSGSESGAIQFLKQIGIEPKANGKWRKLVNLTRGEIKKLTEGIIMRRIEETNPEDIVGPVYILKEEKKEGPLRDVKEFSTLLNACGRLNKASLGIGACLGDERTKRMAIGALKEYRGEIVKALKWYNQNKGGEFVTKEKGFTIINTQDFIMPTIVGTLASIVSKSNDFEDNSLIVSMANMDNNYTKVSMRMKGDLPGIELNVILSEIAQKIGVGNAGGHMKAAGAIIPSDKEEEFISITKQVLRKAMMEEKVV